MLTFFSFIEARELWARPCYESPSKFSRAFYDYFKRI